MLSTCKEINDASATSSLMLTTNVKYLSFDIMTPNLHQIIEMVVLKNGYGLTQWALIPLWPTIKPTILQNIQTITKILICPTKTLQRVNPIGLCAPWDDSYLHN